MSSHYHSERWKEFRKEIIELDGGLCKECERSVLDGVILQVHHTRYISGKMPWEYDYPDCETLCKGCHAVKHGKIRPSSGWDFLGEEDLGELSGNCDCCGTQIRHVFFIQHPYWEPMGVGTICCDNLTGTQLASNHMESLRRFETRQSRFVASSRWKTENNITKIRQKRIRLAIFEKKEGFQIAMNGVYGKKIFPQLEEAKKAAFDVIESGKADKFFQRLRDNHVNS